MTDDTLTACPDCGGALRFDPLLVGDTCGRLTLRGWNVCDGCGKAWHAGRRAVAHERWRVADSGLSVETGHVRIRFDGDHTTKAKLAARLAMLPALEELRDLVDVLVADPRGLRGAHAKLVEVLERCRPAAVEGSATVEPVVEEPVEEDAVDEPAPKPRKRRKKTAQADLFADDGGAL